jgi:4-diphosphocytidyl-2-C-methyl-D-erythritol kinase
MLGIYFYKEDGVIITEDAYAKINLYLHVKERRADGYHVLDSLFMPVTIRDRVTVSSAPQFILTQSGEFAGVLPNQENNIATKAARALAKKAKVLPNVAIHIEKNIPIGAGMAGGSADAAAVLRALNKLWKLEYSLKELADIGLALGADVPFCLYQVPAFVGGIGEDISPIKNFPKLYVVLINPRLAVDTPTIFRKGLRVFSGAVEKPESVGLSSDGLLDFLTTLQNDLTENACCQAPVITKILTVLAGYEEVKVVRMSGSGATCFALLKEKDHASFLVDDIRKSYPDWWVYT